MKKIGCLHWGWRELKNAFIVNEAYQFNREYIERRWDTKLPYIFIATHLALTRIVNVLFITREITVCGCSHKFNVFEIIYIHGYKSFYYTPFLHVTSYR